MLCSLISASLPHHDLQQLPVQSQDLPKPCTYIVESIIIHGPKDSDNIPGTEGQFSLQRDREQRSQEKHCLEFLIRNTGPPSFLAQSHSRGGSPLCLVFQDQDAGGKLKWVTLEFTAREALHKLRKEQSPFLNQI